MSGDAARLRHDRSTLSAEVGLSSSEVLERLLGLLADRTQLCIDIYVKADPFAQGVPVGRDSISKAQKRINEAKRFSDTPRAVCAGTGYPLALGALCALWSGCALTQRLLNRSGIDPHPQKRPISRR